jgi:hypothetical protein
MGYPSFGGGERTRTADFHVANVALYQLSYTPVRERAKANPGPESSRIVQASTPSA